MLLVVSLVFVGLRFFVRARNKQMHLVVSDAWLAIAAINNTAFLVLGVYPYRKGVFAPGFFQYTPHILKVNESFPRGIHSAVPSPIANSRFKIMFILNMLFTTGLIFPRFSILALYYHIIVPALTKLRIALHIVLAYNVITGIVTILNVLFICGPDVASFW
jgi:hypothetical protein